MLQNTNSVGTADDDFAQLLPSASVKAAGGALMVLGFFTALLAVQTALVALLRGPVIVALVWLGTLGPAALILGWNVLRMRGRAALIGTFVAAAIFVGSATWFVFALTHGLFTLLGLAIPGLALIATALVAASIKRSRRADEARERLRAQGLDVGA